MTKRLTTVLMMAVVLLCSAEPVSNLAKKVEGGLVATNIANYGRLSADRISLLPAHLKGPSNAVQRASVKNSQTNDVLRQWPDDAVFLDIAGTDKLKWRVLREQLEDAVNNFPARPDMGAEGLQNARKIVFQQKLKKMVQKYLVYGVIAAEARRLGLKVDEKKAAEYRAKSRRLFEKSGPRGALQLKRMEGEDSWYEHNLRNWQLWEAYAQQVVEPAIKVSDEEVAARLAAQAATNAFVVAQNESKREQIQKIHAKVTGGFLGIGRMDFGDAAEMWSDCPSSDTRGVLTDPDEKPQQIRSGDMHPILEKVYKTLKPGEISGVVETPYSWHILKLLSRNEEEETVEVAHIMLEKERLVPDITEEQARQKLKNSKIRLTMMEKYAELLKKTKIDCLVPLTDAPKKPRNAKKSAAGGKDGAAKGQPANGKPRPAPAGPRKRVIKD